MARSKKENKKKQVEETGIEEFGMDDVDAFADARDKVLLEKAGMTDNHTKNYSDSDDEEAIEGVMDIDSDEDVEKYKKKLQGPLDDSDEEYFRGDGDDSDEENAEGEERWGGDMYGADEAEDEEDEKLLEEEAMRLQKKHMEELNMDDFMLEEAEDWKSEKSKKKDAEKESEEEESDEKFDEMIKNSNKETQMEMISKKYPEYVPLALELKELKDIYAKLKENKTESEVINVQFKALSLYLGSILSYFAVFATKLQNGEKFDMKDEDVMVSILSTRELWRQAKGIRGTEEDEDIDQESSEEGEEVEDDQGGEIVEQSEEEQDDTESESESEATPTTEQETPDFSKLRSIKKIQRKKLEDMDALDIEDKKGRRKTLGFYTSKIDKRDLGKVKADGDMDDAYDEENTSKPKFFGHSRKPAPRGRKRK